MAALLVAMSIMAIASAAAMPVWSQLARREREAELVFRGEQYVRAIALFQRRAGPGVLPPDIEFLVENRFLRRAYRDPITGTEFDVVRAAVTGPARAGEPPGVVGVASRSREESIRLYEGRSHYHEWPFLHQTPRGQTDPGEEPEGRAPESPGDAGESGESDAGQ